MKRGARSEERGREGSGGWPVLVCQRARALRRGSGQGRPKRRTETAFVRVGEVPTKMRRVGRNFFFGAT